MTRMEVITEHLLAKGAQYSGNAGDLIVTDKFTEHIFRNLAPSVRVREWKSGMIEILFVGHEIAAGDVSNQKDFERMPPLKDVLLWIDNDCMSLGKTVTIKTQAPSRRDKLCTCLRNGLGPNEHYSNCPTLRNSRSR